MEDTNTPTLKEVELRKLKALKKAKCITPLEYKKTKVALLEHEGKVMV
jgi:hypothetical protein